MELRPLEPRDAADLRRILLEPAVARWWDVPDDDFPLADDPDATRLVIEVEGKVAGMVQHAEETEPKYRHASIDIFLSEATTRRRSAPTRRSASGASASCAGTSATSAGKGSTTAC